MHFAKVLPPLFMVDLFLGVPTSTRSVREEVTQRGCSSRETDV